LREEFCQPNDLDIWIGLPETEHARCAEMQKPRAMADLGEINAATKASFLEKWSSPNSKGGLGVTAWRTAEIAGSNCHATADSLARMMQLLNDGKIGEARVLSEDIPEKIKAPRVSGLNLVVPFEISFGAGPMHNHPHYYFGQTAETLGHSGWGGSCVFADPVTGLTGAYAMNRQESSLLGDPRPVALIEAVYNCL